MKRLFNALIIVLVLLHMISCKNNDDTPAAIAAESEEPGVSTVRELPEADPSVSTIVLEGAGS